MPFTTREGYDYAPIDPGARWNIDPWVAAPPREVVALHDTLETLARGWCR